MEISEKIQGILATLPTKPGCYLMKNAEAKIIYVGEAIKLRRPRPLIFPCGFQSR